jgi:predicted nucleic acid-binding protein
MKDELRFVFDTNVLISAALFKASVPRQALDLARTIRKGHNVLASNGRVARSAWQKAL